jgi:hypothetical protein
MVPISSIAVSTCKITLNPFNAHCASTNDFGFTYQQADAVIFMSPSLQWTTSRPTRASHTATAHACTAHAFTRFLICRSQPASSTHQASGKVDSHITHRWYGIATTQTKMWMTQQNHMPISAWKDESENNDPEIYDAAAFMVGDTGRNDLVLLDGDDLPQDDVSLTIDEFE